MNRSPLEAFQEAIETWEGLYQADPHDVGNIKRGKTIVGTMRGVTPKVWAAFSGIPVSQVTPEMMRAITLFDAAAVYEKFYYAGPGFDRLKWCAATEVFCDIGWGSGPAVAIKMLQRMIGEHPDGVIGPSTVKSYEDWIDGREQAGVIHSIADMRCKFYRDIVVARPANAKFLAGWLGRANYYRPTNTAWWARWLDSEAPKAAPLPGELMESETAKPEPVTGAEVSGREAQTQQLVQTATLTGGALTGVAGIFKFIPPWAVGALVIGLVVVGALWALRSFGIIKRAS